AAGLAVGVDAERVAVQRTGIDAAGVGDVGIAVGDRVDAARAEHDAHGVDVAGVGHVDVAVIRRRIDAVTRSDRDRADAAAGGGHRGAVVRTRLDAGRDTVAAGLARARVAGFGIGALRPHADRRAVLRFRVDRAVIAGAGRAGVRVRVDADRGAAIAVGVDGAAVGGGDVAVAGATEQADRLAVHVGRDAAAVVQRHVAVLADAENAERGAGIAVIRRVRRVDRAAVARGDVAVARLRADAVGAPAVDRDVAAVVRGRAAQPADVHAHADVQRRHVDVAAVVRGGAAVLGERN